MLGLAIPADILEGFKKEAQFKKGNVSYNAGKKQSDYMDPEAIARTEATRFKKGNYSLRWTGYKNGDKSIRHHKKANKDYWYIRVDTGKWKQWHQVMWADEHGPVPKGHIIVFRDGNQMNVVLDNLEMISMRENMARNTIVRYPAELIGAIKVLHKLKKTINEKQDRRPA